ncbi:MAG: hypothetical protein AMXMBFR23_04350 [Chloroflexota bacterium]
MSRDRAARRERARRPAAASAKPVAPVARAAGGPPQQPAPVRRYLFLFFSGLLIGRVASESFPTGVVDTIDLMMVAGLALTAALSWRAWARRAVEARRREQLVRRRAQQAAAAEDTEES